MSDEIAYTSAAIVERAANREQCNAAAFYERNALVPLPIRLNEVDSDYRKITPTLD
jgi:hypothetical protein